MKIVIGGLPGSGKTTVAKAIAKKFGFRFYSTGNLMRKLARKKSMELMKLLQAASKDPKIDEEIDHRQIVLGKTKDNFVLEGRLGFFLVPNSIKIFLKTDPGVAAERIKNDPKGLRKVEEIKTMKIGEIVEDIKKRMKTNQKRLKKKYRTDIFEEKKFDYVVDTTRLNIKQSIEKVEKIIRKEINKGINKEIKKGKKKEKKEKEKIGSAFDSTILRLNKKIMFCKRCGLGEIRRNGVPGEGRAGANIMLIGQAPGEQEDKTGRPFIGLAGKFLDKELERVGLKREELFITSVVKCLPQPPKNRKPKLNEIKSCRNYLVQQIKLVKPKVIVGIGKIAEKELQQLEKKIYFKKEGIKIMPLAHPSAARRFPKIKKKFRDDLKKIQKANKRFK